MQAHSGDLIFDSSPTGMLLHMGLVIRIMFHASFQDAHNPHYKPIPATEFFPRLISRFVVASLLSVATTGQSLSFYVDAEALTRCRAPNLMLTGGCHTSCVAALQCACSRQGSRTLEDPLCLRL